MNDYSRQNKSNAWIFSICLLAVGVFYGTAYTVSRFSRVTDGEPVKHQTDANAQRVADSTATDDADQDGSVHLDRQPFETGTNLARKIQLAVLRTAIAFVESGGDPQAIGDGGEAVGLLQIHRITVDDVNRILGKKQYTYADRLDPVKSAEMFDISSSHYANYYNDWTDEGIARRWNGGPTGHRKEATLGYWKKVKVQLVNSL